MHFSVILKCQLIIIYFCKKREIQEEKETVKIHNLSVS